MSILKKATIIALSITFFLFFDYYALLIYYARLSTNEQGIINPGKLEVSFKDAVIKIDSSYTDFTDIGVLYGIDEFCRIYANPYEYMSDTLAFLKDPSQKEGPKLIAIISMRNLDDETYIKFFEQCTELYINNLISDTNISSAFTSLGCYNSDVIVKNFYKPKVRRCLKKIKAKTPEAKQMVNLILSGRYWLFRAAGKVDYGEIKNDNIVCSWLLYYTYRTVMFIHNTFHIFPYEDSYKTK